MELFTAITHKCVTKGNRFPTFLTVKPHKTHKPKKKKKNTVRTTAWRKSLTGCPKKKWMRQKIGKNFKTILKLAFLQKQDMLPESQYFDTACGFWGVTGKRNKSDILQQRLQPSFQHHRGVCVYIFYIYMCERRYLGF